MPKGPRGQKRPADVVGNAIKIAKIATGEIEDETDNERNQAAQTLGRMGGKARANKLSKERRSEIARNAASERWKNKK